MIDFKEKAEEIVKKIKTDKNFKNNFEKNPAKAIESILDVDLPDEIVNKIIEIVKAKFTADTLSDITDKLSGLFENK